MKPFTCYKLQNKGRALVTMPPLCALYQLWPSHAANCTAIARHPGRDGYEQATNHNNSAYETRQLLSSSLLLLHMIFL